MLHPLIPTIMKTFHNRNIDLSKARACVYPYFMSGSDHKKNNFKIKRYNDFKVTHQENSLKRQNLPFIII